MTTSLNITVTIWECCPTGDCLCVPTPGALPELFDGLFVTPVTVVRCAACLDAELMRMAADAARRDQAERDAEDATVADLEWHREWDSQTEVES